MTKRQIDWEAVARDYHASEIAVAELARKHGLAAITIYAKAKRDGWARPGLLGAPTIVNEPVRCETVRRPRRRRLKSAENINASRALGRMMGIVNRLADELEQHLDYPEKPGMSATDKKGAADILTSLARALEKLTVLERHANGREQIAENIAPRHAGQEANNENPVGTEDGWDDVQRRLARLAAGKTPG